MLGRNWGKVGATLGLALALGGAVGVVSAKGGAKHPAPKAQPVEAAEGRWSDGTTAAKEVAAGRPLVVRLFVPLCSNDQIDCGSGPAGRAGDLKTNLYWGAAFGVRHFFDRKGSGWERLSVSTSVPGELERVAYRRLVSGGPWEREGSVEEIVVASAIHGDRIDEAVKSFWTAASAGARVTFDDDGKPRDERVSVVGYAGHDRLMDGLELPSEPSSLSSTALPSFVLACYSDSYFGPALRRVGASPLVTTKALMAPEAYTTDAILVALGDNAPRAEVRRRAVAAYAKWQRIEVRTASSMFQ